VYHFHHLLLYLNLKDSGCYSITRPHGRCFAADCINTVYIQRAKASENTKSDDDFRQIWKGEIHNSLEIMRLTGNFAPGNTDSIIKNILLQQIAH